MICVASCLFWFYRVSGVKVMVFNVTFNNISAMSWGTVLLVPGRNRSTRGIPPTCRKSLTNFITWRYIEYTSTWTGFETTTLVVIGTYCIGSCKSNYHMTTTTTVPLILYLYWLYPNYACLFICLKQNVPIYISVDSSVNSMRM